MRRSHFRVAIALLLLLTVSSGAQAADPKEGARAFRLCLPCHSLEPGRHMTGPNLDDVFGRQAGTAKGFDRYSDALRKSALSWDEQTLDAWLKNPNAFLPGSRMTFAVPDDATRANLIAYLSAIRAPNSGLPKPFEPKTDLKAGGSASRVATIGKCRHTYLVTMENGTTLEFWERNLRFKTDSSEEGPYPGKPVLQPSGQQGDRAYVVFFEATEITPAIKPNC